VAGLFFYGSAGESEAPMDQRIFITQLNIEHYRQKLLTEQDEGTRRRIVQLLAEEEAKLAALTGLPGKKKDKEE
jgi:hypothetical protein